jgi:hypothetical protein
VWQNTMTPCTKIADQMGVQVLCVLVTADLMLTIPMLGSPEGKACSF